jgi:hypothetical protein
MFSRFAPATLIEAPMILLLQTYWPMLLVSLMIGAAAGYLAYYPRNKKGR